MTKQIVWMMSLVVAVSISPAWGRGAPDSFADLAEKLLPAVVNISTQQQQEQQQSPFGGGNDFFFQFPPGSPFGDFFDRFNRRFGDNMPQQHSLGSGFIIDARGYVVTNNHVIDQASEIEVILQDETRYQATLIGRDRKTDLALLKIEADKPLPHVKMGDSGGARVGDWVVAIGNPYGLGGSVTAGIISARARDINSGPYDDYIQTDAPINRGNSGGPLFNLDGEVIGINTAIYSPSGGSVGIGFSIPSNLAKTVLAQLRQYGVAKRGWLGVRIESLREDIAESLGLSVKKGVIITDVYPGQPAAQAGIEIGDVILRYNKIEVADVRALQRAVADTGIGNDVSVIIWRSGSSMEVRVNIGDMEQFESQVIAADGSPTPGGGDTLRIDSLGLELASIDAATRRRFNLAEDVRGVMIVNVASNGVAARRGLTVGDIILKAGQMDVLSPQQVAEYIQAIIRDDDKLALFLVRQGDDRRFVTLPVTPS